VSELAPLPEGADVVDARGLRCPLPVIRLAQRARDGLAGDVLEVWATDPAAAADVPAWARLRGHTYLGAREGDPAEGAGYTAYLVRLRAGGTPGLSGPDGDASVTRRP
jgi:TusA-related sulfurtransferase